MLLLIDLTLFTPKMFLFSILYKYGAIYVVGVAIHTYLYIRDVTIHNFGCIDILPLVYHDTPIYCTIQSSVK